VSRYRLNTGFSRTDQVLRTKFDEMTGLMEKMSIEEKTLYKRKEQDYKSPNGDFYDLKHKIVRGKSIITHFKLTAR